MSTLRFSILTNLAFMAATVSGCGDQPPVEQDSRQKPIFPIKGQELSREKGKQLVADVPTDRQVQTIPADYPPTDPAKLDIRIDNNWIRIGGYGVRGGTTTPCVLQQLLGEPDNSIDFFTNRLFFYHMFGIKFFHKVEYSDYIGAFDIFMNLKMDDEFQHLKPKHVYPGKFFINTSEITRTTTVDDLIKLGFKQTGNDWSLELKAISITASTLEDEKRIEFFRISENF